MRICRLDLGSDRTGSGDLSQSGLVEQNAKFRPDDPVAWAEMAKWVIEGMKYWGPNQNPCAMITCGHLEYCDQGACKAIPECVPSESDYCELGGGSAPPTCDCAGKCGAAPDGCGGTCSGACAGGCCSGTTCVNGSDVSACGKDGLVCSQCSGSQTCVSGTCIGACADTCSAAAAGKTQCSGETIQTCVKQGACYVWQNGQTCTGTQTCVNGQCASQSCAGCWTGNTCMPGNTTSSCGINGQPCSAWILGTPIGLPRLAWSRQVT